MNRSLCFLCSLAKAFGVAFCKIFLRLGVFAAFCKGFPRCVESRRRDRRTLCLIERPAGAWNYFIPGITGGLHHWVDFQHPFGIGFRGERNSNRTVTFVETDISIIHVIRGTCRGSRVGCNPSISSQANRLYSAAVQIKKTKKSLPFIHASSKPGQSKKQKRVDAFLAFQLKATFSHLNSIHTITQLHEKEIRFTIRTCPP